uniref:Uncharacterized protein n=1 Tax=Nothobranchius rachovii TaxID=451742 RepID=A0A1A8QHX5_9TELE
MGHRGSKKNIKTCFPMCFCFHLSDEKSGGGHQPPNKQGKRPPSSQGHKPDGKDKPRTHPPSEKSAGHKPHPKNNPHPKKNK